MWAPSNPLFFDIMRALCAYSELANLFFRDTLSGHRSLILQHPLVGRRTTIRIPPSLTHLAKS